MKPTSNRRLAAIMFTDIQGYTALMQSNEKEGIEMRKRHREIFNATTEKFGGNILQYYGDGTLSIFDSVVNAVKCGHEMQIHFQTEPFVPVRIGIHLGDIIVKDDEVIGDAVNIASRIESMAVVGSVLVSDLVQRDLKNHGDIQTQSLGFYELKNVSQPVEVFAISNIGLVVPEANQIFGKVKPLHLDVQHNLPNPLTSFVGRIEEIEKIKKLQLQNRLVTLYGPGGTGKTRLATEIAKQTLGLYPGGVFFIDLSPLENSEMVIDTIAQTLNVNKGKDISIEATIAQNVSQENVLLVIDNCEHVIDKSASFIKYLLTHTEHPKILITSREVLNIPAELKYYVPSLTVPERSINLHEIDQYESLLLFQDRARLNNPNFALSESNLSYVTTICLRLDGIPLALELAAARVNFMGVETILKRLENQFKLLRSSDRSTVPRQQTIRATLDWSHDLLTEDEKLLFYRLSIFAGNFDLEDAEFICSCDIINEEDVIDHLSHLTDKSLVVGVKTNGKHRYRLLEVMKEYGKEKIDASEIKRLNENYCQFYLEKIKQSYLNQFGDNSNTMKWLILENENIEAALEMLNNNPSQQIEMTGCLSWYWWARSNYSTSKRYLKKVLKNYPYEDISRGRALCELGILEGYFGGDYALALDSANKGIEILRKNNASIELVAVLYQIAFMNLSGDITISTLLCNEGLKLAEQLGDPLMILRYKTMGGGILTNQFLADEAEDIVKENLLESRKINSPLDIDFNLHFFADIPMIRKDYNEASNRYLEGAQSSFKHGYIFQSNLDLQGVGMCLCAQGQHVTGLKLFGASEAKFEILGVHFSPPDTHHWGILINRTVGKSIAELGEKRANEIMAEGRLIKLEDAILYANKLVKNNNIIINQEIFKSQLADRISDN